MGLPGLMSYVSLRSDVFYRRYELKDTRLVIDGNNLSCWLYKSQGCMVSIFGGDYDSYYERVKNFFLDLKKCNVEAIVVLDGGHENKKLKELRRRARQKIMLLKNFQNKQWTDCFVPLFLSEVFSSVLRDLEIKHFKCWFEADKEIASLALSLGCPVLSGDSDFYIFGCSFVPLSTVFITRAGVKVSSDHTGYWIDCKIYDVSSLIRELGGKKCMLPLLAALLGNDYVDPKIFNNFLSHIGRHFYKSRVRSITMWLKSEDSVESAVGRITSHMKKTDVAKAKRAIDLTVESFEIRTQSILPHIESGINKIEEDEDLSENKELAQLPGKVLQLFRKALLPSFVMDVIHLGQYFAPLQVEDVNRQSSHHVSYPIISAIFSILSTLTGRKSNWWLNEKSFGHFTKRTLVKGWDYGKDYDVKSLIDAPADVRIGFIYQVLSFTESDRYNIELFDGKWTIYIMCFVYWSKNLGRTLSESHFHSLLLATFANFVQSRLGYFKNYSKFMESKAATMQKLSNVKSVVGEGGEKSFPDLLDGITELEYLTFNSKFIKLRRFEQEVIERGYFMSTLHVFATFQSVLYHVCALNNLLDRPLPPLDVAQFYCGTLLYNLYYMFNRRKNVGHFACELIRGEPNILAAYTFAVDSLTDYRPGYRMVENPTRPAKPKKRRRRGKKRS